MMTMEQNEFAGKVLEAIQKGGKVKTAILDLVCACPNVVTQIYVAAMRRCPIYRMVMEPSDTPYCFYCPRLMQDAQMGLDDWIPGE